MAPDVRAQTVAAAQRIIDSGGWCVFEVCIDVPAQRWEARVVIFDLHPEAVADTVAEELAYEPELDARLTGCERHTLHPDPAMGAHLCYLADPTLQVSWPSPGSLDLPV